MTHPTSTGVDPKLAALLAYAVWWVSGLVFLVAERHDRGVRFHAAQSVILFGTASLLLMALGFLSAAALLVSNGAYSALQLVSNGVWLIAAGLWVVLMLRTWRGETWRVPFVAALADRLVAKTS